MEMAYVAALPFLFLLSLHRLLAPCSHSKINGKDETTQLLPPSPPAIPVLDHLHLLGEKLIHAARYGPVFFLRLGACDAVVVSSAACSRECFTEHDMCFANRPRLPSLLLVSFGGATLPMCSSGPYWRNHHRVATV